MPEFPIPTTILFVALASIPLALIIKQWLTPKPLPDIPHYPITSILGDIPAIARDNEKYGDFLDDEGLGTRAIHELGPVYQLLIGPFSKQVVVADAQEIDDVLLRSNIQRAIETSEIIREAFYGVIPYGMVSLKTDDMWRKHRRLITPLMSPTYLSQMSPAISANAQLLVELWKKKIVVTKEAGGTCFSAQSDFEYSTLDSISEIIIGRPVNAVPHALDQLPKCKPIVDAHGGTTFTFDHQPLFNALRYLVQITGVTIRLRPFAAKAYNMYLAITPTFRRQYGLVVGHVETCKTEAKRAIEEALAIGEEAAPAKSLVGMVVQKESTGLQDKLSEVELRDEALTFLLAGHDTTSQNFQWCMKYFANAPHVQRALRSELLAALDDSPDKRPLTFADVSSPEKTPYLEAVLYEVLRVARVGVATSKLTTAPVTILGHYIPAGTNLLFLTAASSDLVTAENQPNLRALDGVRSESSLKHGIGGRGLWTNPKEFNPERWLVDDGTGKKKFNPKAGVATPFGVGVRACAGKSLAQLELKIYIATLNLVFFFEKVPEELDSYKQTFVVSRAPSMAYVAPRPWRDGE